MRRSIAAVSCVVIALAVVASVSYRVGRADSAGDAPAAKAGEPVAMPAFSRVVFLSHVNDPAPTPLFSRRSSVPRSARRPPSRPTGSTCRTSRKASTPARITARRATSTRRAVRDRPGAGGPHPPRGRRRRQRQVQRDPDYTSP